MMCIVKVVFRGLVISGCKVERESTSPKACGDVNRAGTRLEARSITLRSVRVRQENECRGVIRVNVVKVVY